MTKRPSAELEKVAVGKGDRKNAGVLKAGLERLALASRTQELAGLRKLPRLRGYDRRSRLITWLLDIGERRFGLKASNVDEGRRRWGYTFLVLGLRIVTGEWKKSDGLRSIASVVEERVRDHDARVRTPAGYADVSDREDAVVRAALLLRLLKRPGAAVELLMRRLRSGRPSPETRRWLSFLLCEGGEAKIAPLADPDTPAEPTIKLRRAQPDAPLKFGVVMTTMLDSPVFRCALRSLVESDYRGDIVVVEDGGDPTEGCRQACEAASVRYVKTTGWVGSASAINIGIHELDADTDIVIFCHNDVLWPPRWFDPVEQAWVSALPTGRVSLLNLGYIQLKRRTDPALYELFLRGRYHDLVWLLRAMRDVPALMAKVQDAQVRPGEQPFGLARDPWVDSVPALRFQSGRFSVAASFPRSFWREMGEFDPDLVYAFDLQMLQHSINAHRWSLFVNTSPLVHLKSTDTRTVSPEKQVVIGGMFQRTYEAFQRKYGWQIEHYLNLFFSETMVVHGDAALRAVNSGRFADADYVFDDFFARLATRQLANCELTWCRSRATCPYV